MLLTRLIFTLPLSMVLACGANFEQYQPTEEDDSRRIFQKAETLNYDLNAIPEAIAAYEYLLNRFSFGEDNDAIEDIVWSHYGLGLIYFREGDYVKAEFHLKQAEELGAEAEDLFQLITNAMERQNRSTRVQEAVILANRLLTKLEKGHQLHRATYEVEEEEEEPAT